MRVIRTNRLRVRRFSPADAENLYKLLSDGDVMRYLEPPFDRERSDAFLRDAGLCDPPLVYAVEDGGGFAGYVIFHPYDENSYELGWVLAKSCWHRGYALELTEALIDRARGRTRRLVIECSPHQRATAKIARRCGFEYAGFADGCDLYRLEI